uniref:Transmembrane protein 198 n=1 Tax=Calidris pygmaea TaxID=425635 RepID=A0A8C3KE27_9CHAR
MAAAAPGDIPGQRGHRGAQPWQPLVTSPARGVQPWGAAVAAPADTPRPAPGYRCFKAIMFLSGLLFGSAVIFLLCYKERVLETQLSLEAS